MTLNKKFFQKVWKNRKQIFEGWWNRLFTTQRIREIIAHRDHICKQNTCGYYDPEGKSPKAFVPGTDTCGACGCQRITKIHSPSSMCGLIEVGKVPLWNPVED